MITSRAAANAAPRVANTTAIASSETIRYSSACTATVRVITIAVAMTATMAAVVNSRFIARHGIRLRMSTGGVSRSASPLSLPGTASPATR